MSISNLICFETKPGVSLLSEPPHSSPSVSHVLVLGLILLAAAFLRFYDLGVPMLLHDEALVSNAALHDWGYILRRALYTDAHPPFYYYLCKIILQIGSSEFILRFLSALCGVASVYFLYRLGAQTLSQGTGLIAAALLATDMFHVALSRVLRPHCLMMLLTIVCIYRLILFLERPTKRNLLASAGLNILVSLWHFSGALILGTQLAVVVAAMVLGKLAKREVLLWCVATFMSLSVVVIPLIIRLGQFPGVSLEGATFSWTFTRTIENLYEILTLLPLPWVGVAGVVFFVLGLCCLWARRARLAAVLTVVIFLPLITLVAARYGIIYLPQHISFILPIVVVVIAHGMRIVPVRPEIIATVLVCFGTFFIFTYGKHDLYQENSGMMINHNMCQRPIFRALPAPFTRKMVAGFWPVDQIDFINWELIERGSGNIRENDVTCQDETVDFYLIKSLSRDLPQYRSAFSIENSGFKNILNASFDCNLALTAYRIPRTPVFILDSLPWKRVVTADPEDFFRHVFESHNLMPYFSPLGNLLYPSQFDTPSTFSFRIENHSNQIIPNVDLGIVMTNTLSSNVFEVDYAFDGDSPQRGLVVQEVIPRGVLTLNLGRPKLFKMLDITVRMLCSSALPSFYNNPETVRFRSLSLAFEKANPQFDSDIPTMVTGLDSMEFNGQHNFRWARGPETCVSFRLDQDQDLNLELGAKSNFTGQRIEIFLNGVQLGGAVSIQTQAYQNISLPIPARRGANTLTIRYGLWNHGDHGIPGETFEKDDPRPLSMSFSMFRLKLPGSAPQ